MNPPDYIGKTAAIAAMLWRQIPKLKTATDPAERRYLFTGDPGLGKTDIAEHLAAELTGDTFERVHARLAVNTEIVNGQSCGIEVVRRWQEAQIYKPLFGDCRVYVVDECDAISPQAANEMRTLLDQLSTGTVMIATTNKPVSELQEQLQSRFKVCYFEPVPDDVILNWLVNTHKIPPDYASRIVSGAKGNVRAARIDALAWHESNV